MSEIAAGQTAALGAITSGPINPVQVRGAIGFTACNYSSCDFIYYGIHEYLY
jgi:hypothetical protein